MKAVIYARYSSDNQREESIEGQIRDCMSYAEYNDIQVDGNYIDRALSAKTFEISRAQTALCFRLSANAYCHRDNIPAA